MNAPSTSTTNSARHRCFMLSPNADERGSLDANSYKGGHLFSGANLRMGSGSVKQNPRSFPQNPPAPPPFRKSASIAKLQERDEIFPRESEDISKLGRDIDPSRNQLPFELRDHAVQRFSVVVAIGLHLDDSPLPLQKSKQSRDRAAVAQNQLSNTRRLLLASANIMRQVIAGLQIPIAWRRGPPMPAEERAVRLDLAEALHLPNRDVSQLLSGANA